MFRSLLSFFWMPVLMGAYLTATVRPTDIAAAGPPAVALPEKPAPTRPFPQHTFYHEGSILPDQISRQSLDDSVRSFYRQWKQRYVRKGCEEGEAYIWFEGTRGNNQCVSEGQG